MAVNADLSGLVELLSCPVCRSPLTSEPLRLRCRGCGRSFGFEGRVPVFLPGGVRPDRRPTPLARLHSATLGNPWLYDLIQSHVGGRQIVTRVAKELDELRAATVLDVGAGTGMVSGLVPRDARYLWLDNDPLKLRGLLKRPIDCYAVLCDAARLPVRRRRGRLDFDDRGLASPPRPSARCVSGGDRSRDPGSLRLRRCAPRTSASKQAAVAARPRSVSANRGRACLGALETVRAGQGRALPGQPRLPLVRRRTLSAERNRRPRLSTVRVAVRAASSLHERRQRQRMA